MAVELYEHNQRAYLSAAEMLERTGKAAIVHPTGTGKSFIAFKFVEQNANKRFLWLSPSEYIYKTQCESVRRIAPDLDLSDVSFYTYAKLTYFTEADFAALTLQQPDYIILDEFHRAGAPVWQQVFEHLLSVCPSSKLLGLTATEVRYLDNQRNMADEIFDGNIASEMTLGEAIVRGILPAPKYVTTVFRYQADLARYQRRIDNTRAPGTEQQNQFYLNALRRALEQSDGLDKVFARHIQNHAGKYIAFCASVEHMNEMIAHVPEWFATIDTQPHIYKVYSDDPETSKAFTEFKADESGHLKLLFCIDMLNEGVHVRGISGVILFRPTVSPIIYKQQIGRALMAGDNTTPLIFDVVNNVESLCSIDFLQEEMRTAIQRMYAEDEGDKIVTERFEIIEQVKNCRNLFEKLQNSLSSTWEQYYAAASIYYAENGNLNVSRRYVTPDGLSLGNWISTQRKVRAGKCVGNLTEQKIARLNQIGMVWENRTEIAWERGYQAAKAYYERNGNLTPQAKFVDESGFALGVWLSNLRAARANGERGTLLTDERIAALDRIGMEWSVISAKWEKNYAEAVAYYEKNGDLLVPVGYKTENGFALGMWLRNLRSAKVGQCRSRLTEEQIRRLDAIGMVWGNRNDIQWQRGYDEAKCYFEQHGDLNVPVSYVTKSGLKLGRWVRNQRNAYQSPEKSNCKLTPERIALLEQIGIVWERLDSWEYRFELLKQYKDKHSNLDIPPDYKTADNIWLGKWLYLQRRELSDCTLPKAQAQKLYALGVTPCNQRKRTWNENYKILQQYFAVNGSADIPQQYETETGVRIGRWLFKQKVAYRQGKLKPERTMLLKELQVDMSTGRQSRRKNT